MGTSGFSYHQVPRQRAPIQHLLWPRPSPMGYGRAVYRLERVRAVCHGDTVLWGPPRNPVTLEGGSRRPTWF